MNSLFSHRSIRKYKSTPVPSEVLDKITQAAIRGSNTGNMQMYSIIVTTDEKLKQQLWEAHFKQEMVRQAPVILTFVADIHRFHKWCELRNAGKAYDNFLWFVNATIDATIAAQNAALAAEENGLGICYLGTTTYMADKIIEILNLPHGTMPITALAVGYPDENPPMTDRLPADAVVFDQTYRQISDDEINSWFYEKENSDFTKQLIEENQTENLAQIFTQKRYKKDDNVYFSVKFMELLEKQGFMNNEKD